MRAGTLDPAIASYLDGLGSPLERLEALRAEGTSGSVGASEIPSPVRLYLADGRTFKLQILGSAAKTRGAVTGLRAVAMECFPPVLAAGERCLLTPWIEGVELDPATTDGRAADTCADLQARLHCRPVPSGCTPRRDVDAWWRWAGRTSDELVGAGLLSTAQRDRVMERAERFRPPEAERSWVHRDLCPQNVVVATDGKIWIVDNESLEVGLPEYDLARTWCRWPMPPERWDRYLAAYSRRRSPLAFIAHFPFWAAVALLGSAYFRWRHGIDGASEAVARFVRLAPPRSLRGTPGPDGVPRRYRRSGLTLHVSCGDPSDQRWLDGFLQPWFSTLPENADPPVPLDATGNVGLERDTEALRALLGQGGAASVRTSPCFSLDGGCLRLPAYPATHGGERGTALVDEKFGVVYFVARNGGGGSVRIVADPTNARARLGLLRVAREYLYQRLRAAGAALLHGSAVRYRGRVVVFLGPKRAGKTTLLAHCLDRDTRPSREAPRFVANDRVEVSARDRGFVALGIPTILSVRPGSMDLLPGLRSALGPRPPAAEVDVARGLEADADTGRTHVPGRSGRRPVHLSPLAFCRALGVEPRAGGPLAALVFLEPADDARSIRLRRLDAAEMVRRLEGGTAGTWGVDHRDRRPGRGPGSEATVFVPRPGAAAAAPQPPASSPARLAASVPGFACQVGREALGSPAAILDDLVPRRTGEP